MNVPINILDHCNATVGGDPALANAQSGKVFADAIVDAACRLVEHMKTAPRGSAGRLSRRARAPVLMPSRPADPTL